MILLKLAGQTALAGVQQLQRGPIVTMSGALSIFQKACPSCAASVAVDADRCACGHDFADGSGALSADQAVLRDEELYENYLAARAAQAAEAARAADEALAEEPDNRDRASAAELAREVAKSLETDLNEQRRKIAALRKVLGPRTAARPQPAPAPSSPPASPSRPQPRSSTAPAAAAPPRPAPALPPKPSVDPAVSGTAAAAAASRAPQIRAPQRPAMTGSNKAAEALQALKQAKARETVAGPAIAAPAAVNPPVSPAPAATVTTTPPESFRTEQAARAARALAEHPARTDGKDCPNCTAVVPLATTRCRCGYFFATGGNDLPTLTLCTSDFTALRNSLKLNIPK